MPTENKPAEPFGPNGRTFHVHLSVRGALRDFSKRQLKGMFRFECGRACTADEAKIICLRHWPRVRRFCLLGPRAQASTFPGAAVPAMTWYRRRLLADQPSFLSQ